MAKNELTADLLAGSTIVKLTTANITAEDLQSFISKQIHIWNNTDPNDRLIKMNEIYTEDVAFYDHKGTVFGKVELNERISQLQQKFEGSKFSLDKIDNCYNVVTYYWNYGPESNPALISGMDLIILEQGKIRSLNVFVDHLPA
jgi:hypothetical protein